MIKWNEFFDSRNDTQALTKFATGDISVRKLAKSVKNPSATRQAYQIASKLRTVYGRRLARKALARRGTVVTLRD